MWNEVLMQVILVIIIPAVGTLLVAALGMAFSFLKGKIKNDTFKTYLGLVEDEAYSVVESLQETVVDDMKAKNKDGKLTEEEVQEITISAYGNLVEALPNKVLDFLEDNGSDIGALIDNKIHSALNNVKKQK